MTQDRQSQRAGQGSTQVQATNVFTGTVSIGVDEERAREIATEQARKVMGDFAVESASLIQERVAQFDDRVIPLLDAIDSLDSFAEPAFIRSYRKAQEGAAASERPTDYDMLAAMLADRATRPRDRPAIAAIDSAIEVMDRVDDEALRAMTIFNALTTTAPMASTAKDGLNTLEKALSALLDGSLPAGPDWIDHLEILNAVRVNPVSDLHKFGVFISRVVPGYVSPGLLGTDVPRDLFSGPIVYPWGPLVMDHEYKPGFKRVAAPNEKTHRGSLRNIGVHPSVIDAIHEQAKGTLNFGSIDDDAVAGFMAELHTNPALSQIATWWDQIPTHFTLTAVGRTLARANMFRLDPGHMFPRPGDPD